MVYIAAILIAAGLIFLWQAFQGRDIYPEPLPKSYAPLVQKLQKRKKNIRETDEQRAQAEFSKDSSKDKDFQRLKTAAPEKIQGILRMDSQKIQQEDRQILVKGSLYLDNGRYIHYANKNYSELPSRFYEEISRVGVGTMIVNGSSFLIHCKNTSYSYSAGDLDQILFQSDGVALIPIAFDQPTALFLTQESNELKRYIKKNARIYHP